MFILCSGKEAKLSSLKWCCILLPSHLLWEHKLHVGKV